MQTQSKLIKGGSSSALGFCPGAVTMGAALAPPKGLACYPGQSPI